MAKKLKRTMRRGDVFRVEGPGTLRVSRRVTVTIAGERGQGRKNKKRH